MRSKIAQCKTEGIGKGTSITLIPEGCIAGVSKDTKKSTKNVMDRKEIYLVFLGNLLLLGTMILSAVIRTQLS